MKTSAMQRFTVSLEPDQTRLRWVIARIPFDVVKVWIERRGLRVRGEIEGFPFRSSLFRDARMGGHFLLVNKKMQAGAKATVGSRVRIWLEPDLEEREAILPPELVGALKGDRRLPKWFEGLSYSCRKEIGDWVGEPQKAELRLKRAEGMAERLLLTLEGETEPPPILQAAFLGVIAVDGVGAAKAAAVYLPTAITQLNQAQQAYNTAWTNFENQTGISHEQAVAYSTQSVNGANSTQAASQAAPSNPTAANATATTTPATDTSSNTSQGQPSQHAAKHRPQPMHRSG